MMTNLEGMLTVSLTLLPMLRFALCNIVKTNFCFSCLVALRGGGEPLDIDHT